MHEERPLQPSEDPLLGDYLDEWLERRVTQLAPTTHRSYHGVAERYIKPGFRDAVLSSLDRRAIEDFYAGLVRNGGRWGRPLSPQTIAHVHTVLAGALQDAVLDGLIDVNPAARARRPQRDPRQQVVDDELRVWTVEQAARFLDEVEDHPQRALWHLAVGTGARRGELLGLRWSEVDLDARVVRITRSLSRVDGVTRLLGTKTSRLRTLSIGPDVADALAREREAQEARQRAAGSAWNNEWGLVFTDGDGTAVRPGRVTNEFRRLVTVLELPRIRLHDLRHTHASLLKTRRVATDASFDRSGNAGVAVL